MHHLFSTRSVRNDQGLWWGWWWNTIIRSGNEICVHKT